MNIVVKSGSRKAVIISLHEELTEENPKRYAIVDCIFGGWDVSGLDRFNELLFQDGSEQ